MLFKELMHSTVVSLIFCGALALHSDIDHLNNDRFTKVAAKYRQQLADEYTQILQGFFALCGGVSESAWQAHMQECLPGYLQEEAREIAKIRNQNAVQLKPETVALAQEIIRKANLNRPIQIIADQQTDHDVYTLHSALVIKEKQFQLLYPTRAEKEAILWHEMQHLINKDIFVGYCIDKLYQKHFLKIHDYEAWRALVHRWNFFFERRADILGALVPKQIQPRLQSLQYLSNPRYFNSSADECHPPLTERCAMIAKIAQELSA